MGIPAWVINERYLYQSYRHSFTYAACSPGTHKQMDLQVEHVAFLY